MMALRLVLFGLMCMLVAVKTSDERLYIDYYGSLYSSYIDGENLLEEPVITNTDSQKMFFGYDPVEDYVYFTHNDQQGIFRQKTEGYEKNETVVKDEVMSAVLDYVNGFLHWISRDHEMCNMNIRSDERNCCPDLPYLSKNAKIAINMTNGVVYYTSSIGIQIMNPSNCSVFDKIETNIRGYLTVSQTDNIVYMCNGERVYRNQMLMDMQLDFPCQNLVRYIDYLIIALKTEENSIIRLYLDMEHTYETNTTRELRSFFVSKNVAECADQLGMESGEISHKQLTTSDTLININQLDDEKMRLNSDSGFCFEAIESQIADQKHWIQVNLRPNTLMRVSGIITQGHFNTTGWVTKYSVSYMYNKSWIPIGNGEVQNFNGNYDSKAPVTNLFLNSVNAQSIRIYIVDWKRQPCIRFDVLGCNDTSTSTGTGINTTDEDVSTFATPTSFVTVTQTESVLTDISESGTNEETNASGDIEDASSFATSTLMPSRSTFYFSTIYESFTTQRITDEGNTSMSGNVLVSSGTAPSITHHETNTAFKQESPTRAGTTKAATVPPDVCSSHQFTENMLYSEHGATFHCKITDEVVAESAAFIDIAMLDQLDTVTDDFISFSGQGIHGVATHIPEDNSKVLLPMDSDEISVSFSREILQSSGNATAVISYVEIDDFEKNQVILQSPDESLFGGDYVIIGVISIAVYNSLRVEIVGPVNFSVPKTVLMNGSVTSEKIINEVCAFFVLEQSHWSADGCITDTTANATHCSCNHLTSFAILMQVSSNSIGKTHANITDIITKIGLSLSLISLVVTLTAYIVLPGLWKSLRNNIHKHLVGNMIVFYLMFLVGSENVKNKGLCKVTAILLHYEMQTVFMWMSAEAIYLVFKVVRRTPSKFNKIRYYMIACYTSSFLMVCLSISIRYDCYGTKDVCWLAQSCRWTVIFPAILIVAFNTGVLLKMVHIIYSRTGSMTNKTAKSRNVNENKKQLRSAVKGSLLLLPILGITWIFGPFAGDSLVLNYIFTISNSLQGVFIFIAYCLCDKEVREAFNKFLNRRSNTNRVNASFETETYSMSKTTGITSAFG
ncbi:uncharacterized protein LOC117107191 [Anneissia japonica]|uniref:uncharacterized protein LOC117107191 n=1 Tax=Anneissia japonica TaxID=1529436 RepID=UPI0014259C70|nr:uncharacterized protein LOC117107191 [Anneissia japonica]